MPYLRSKYLVATMTNALCVKCHCNAELVGKRQTSLPDIMKTSATLLTILYAGRVPTNASLTLTCRVRDTAVDETLIFDVFPLRVQLIHMGYGMGRSPDGYRR